jgi:succinate dehydrogenase / fumarate reductase cytochrome b subunit
MADTGGRPLSPHLTIWKWGPAMAVSIFHRASGIGLATVGAVLLCVWLLAASSGKEAYAALTYWASEWLGGWPGRVVLIGLTWAFFQHLGSGLRHFVMDVGAGYELKANRTGSILVFVFAVLATAAVWGWLCFVKG